MVKWYFAILLIIDQVSKILVRPDTHIDLGILSINFVTNTGISFGLFKGNNLAMIIIYLVVLGLLIYYLLKQKPMHQTWYYLIITGLIGNLIDRIFRGYVIDFINFKIWPVFNLADVFIVAGVVMIIIMLIKNKE